MEERNELKDPEHPEAKAATEATARLLIEVHRNKLDIGNLKQALITKPEEDYREKTGSSEGKL